MHLVINKQFITYTALSDYELTLGEFLFSNGENDVTHAGDVMKQVGRAHDQNAKLRLVLMVSQLTAVARGYGLPFHYVSLNSAMYRIGGIFCGEKILRVSCFRKNYAQKTKNLYGSHLIFDRFAKI